MTDQFLARFPCYVVVMPPYNLDPLDGMMIVDHNTNYAIHKDAAGYALLAFTDEDSLSAFLKRTDAEMAMKVERPDQLLSILMQIKVYRGAELGVRFDCSDVFPGFHVPFSEIVQP